MKVTVLYNQGGTYPLNREQKITDEDTHKTAIEISNALKQSGYETDLVKVTPEDLNLVDNIDTDLVFNLCEWSGKDYPLAVRVIKKLDDNKIPYTGADSSSYEWCSNKIKMKKLFDKFGIITPKWLAVRRHASKKILESLSQFNFPLIMKPAYEHCGIGIRDTSIVKNNKNIKSRIERYKNFYDQPVIIEEFIAGREFQVTIIRNGQIKIFPPAEIIFGDRKGKEKIYSFGSKWGKSREESIYINTIIHKNSRGIINDIIKAAKSAFTKMGCRGYARADIKSRNHEIYLLEINVNPALDPDPEYTLTASSMAAGFEYKDLVVEIAKAGLS